ncbi:trypsin-like peptidase domain-containing protein [Methylobacillus flagellatus]|uniref:trypsin-like peptidase domain-containing protein n=1 Tax=Methylobacillus flagellatus TaxID=405 RepID=UPI0010F9DC0F|nr:trypsin-like peptidase domain-containing protein [Methylobacillus flagellatus]
MRHLLILLLTFSALPTAHAYDKVKLLQSFFGTVMIRGYKPDGGMAYGSGVVVAENKVLTNCHIFRQTKQPWVSQGEDSYTVNSVQADRWHDLCLMTTTGLPVKPVELGRSADMKKGQQVVAIGHSSGVPNALTSLGSVKSLFKQQEGFIVRSTARFALGASGSGLYDGDGRLIGINTFKTTGRVAYFYAVPVEWLDSLQKQPVETVFPIVGQAFWEDDEANKPFFMQVAVPEINGDWAKLEQVARAWIKAEPANSDAWYELGNALENMSKLDEAETAYRKSIALEPLNTDSLFRIGVIASNKGDKNEVKAVNVALLKIDEDLAAEFSKTVGCKGSCE